ncbi:MAG TPA: hypothetical protein VM261_15760 [Kofleriaceae bacterium]|nr:hypothetical protein [Kofleriaceae bacterium]
MAETCGNGTVDVGETCDDGNNDSGDTCAGDCVSPPSCGDGDLDPGEECDDGNRASGDGCQATCRLPIRPPARWAAALAYDSARDVLVMFGGYSNVPLRDTWEWNGIDWIERVPPEPLPPRRGRAAMAFDPVRQRVLMFGGYDSMNGALDDFWEWDGQTWHQIERADHPAGSIQPAMVFDAERGVANLYRAEPGESVFELFQWNGSEWTRRFNSAIPSPQEHPSPLGHPAMAFHAAYGQTFVIGSSGQAGTWFWDDVRWRESSVPSPNRFVDGTMAYDKVRARLVYFGGFSEEDPTDFGWTWEYDSNGWINRGTSPVLYGRGDVAMEYSEALQEVVVFGGRSESSTGGTTLHDDLWSWDGSAWRERR